MYLFMPLIMPLAWLYNKPKFLIIWSVKFLVVSIIFCIDRIFREERFV